MRHCGVTPLWCRHTTTGMHGSFATVALPPYGAGIRPQACMGAYATEILTYDHRQARKLRHCGVPPLWCRHTTTGIHCGVMPLWCRNRAVVLHAHQYDAKLDMLL